MNQQLFIATANGLVTGERDEAGWKAGQRMLEGQALTRLAASDGARIAGTRDGIYRSTDRGQNWVEASDGLTTRYVRALTAHPTLPGLVFAGTEPAAIFVSRDGGKTWREAPEIAHLRYMHGWFLPYSPGAGCIRAFTDELLAILSNGELYGTRLPTLIWRRLLPAIPNISAVVGLPFDSATG